MIRLNKKILSLLSILVFSTSLLVSCGSSSKGSINETKSEINASEEDKESLKENSEFIKNIDIENSFRIVNYLSTEIGVRLAGEEGEIKGSEYIKSEFEKMGYETKITEFEFTPMTSASNTNKISRNVEAVKKSKDDSSDCGIIYVTAHYDSVKISPGANDNGSGVAAMMEIANALKNIETDREIRFVAFGAEEEGLYGSYDYVMNLTQDEVSRSIGCFNLDMVATDFTPNSELGVYTADGKTNLITEEIAKVGKELEILSTSIVSYEGEFDCVNGMGVTVSDHTAFTAAEIPAALFINIRPSEKNAVKSLEPYYHTKGDSMDNFSKERLERSIILVGQAVYNIACNK